MHDFLFLDKGAQKDFLSTPFHMHKSIIFEYDMRICWVQDYAEIKENAPPRYRGDA